MPVHRTVVVADLHAGSTVAVWPEGAPLPDGGTWELSRPQRMLWRYWQQMVDEVRALDGVESVVVLGDVIDGGNPKGGLITDRLDYQAGAAVELLTPLKEKAERLYLVRGTEWHTGKGDQHVTAVARDLEAVPIPSTGELTWPELYLDLGGRVVHCAHHIGVTSNPMYEATAVLGALLTLRLELQSAYGRSAPDVWAIARAHRHRTITVSKEGRWGVVVAGWKLKDAFTYKVAPNTLPNIGYAILESDGEKITATTRTFPLPKPHIERGA